MDSEASSIETMRPTDAAYGSFGSPCAAAAQAVGMPWWNICVKLFDALVFC